MSENFEAEQNTDGANPPDVRELSEVPAVEVISRAAVMLMSSAAEKLGLSDADPSSSPPYLDLDEARRVITALAGLVTASVEYLGLMPDPSVKASKPCSAPSVRRPRTRTSQERDRARSSPVRSTELATANKTQPTPEDVDAFISRVDDRKRADAVELISLLSAATGEPAVMWGSSIIGFGGTALPICEWPRR